MGEFEKALAGATLPLLARIPLGKARPAVFAGAVVLGLAVVAVVASVWSPAGPELFPDRAVVVPFSNPGGGASGDSWASYSAYWVAHCLLNNGVVEGPGPDPVFDWWYAASEKRRDDPEFDPRRALAENFRAGILVEGSVLIVGDSLRLTGGFAEAEDPGGRQQVDAVQVHQDQLQDGAEALCQELSVALTFHLDREWNPEGANARHYNLPPSLPVWQAWRASAEAWVDGNLSEVLRQCERAIELEPTYAPAKVCQAVAYQFLGNLARADSILTEAEELPYRWAPGHLAWRRFIRANLMGDRETAYEVMKEENYGDPQNILYWAGMALALNRPREALEVLTHELDADSPYVDRTAGYWSSLAESLHMLGRHRRELRQIRDGRRRHPDDPGLIMAEIRAQAARGHVREANDLVDEAVAAAPGPVQALGAFLVAAQELRAHEHWKESVAVGERGLAYLQGLSSEEVSKDDRSWNLLFFLYGLERWEEAAGVADDLVAEWLWHPPTLRNLLGYKGAIEARMGRREEARTVADRLAAMEIPYDRGKAHYQRARIEALLGNEDQAVSLLRQAHRDGWGYSLGLHTEMDFEGLKGFGPFEEFSRPKG
jgi:Flp pilus assembly protein TadD